MKYETKRVMSFLMVGGYLFLGGCEYAVILPSCLSYLKTLGATNENWLGFTVSAYSFSAAISGIIGGRLSDIYAHHTKTIAMVSIILMMFGSLQYTAGISVWNVLISRLICGCGTAAGSAMLAEVCRVTAVEERTPILAICNATRQLGILVGPVFQLILTYFNFTLFGFQITPLNSPGIFMAGLWTVYSVMCYFMFFNLSAELKDLRRQQRRSNLQPSQRASTLIGPRSPPQPSQTSPMSEQGPEQSGPSLGHQLIAQRAISEWGLDASGGPGHALGSQSGVESSIAQSQVRRQRMMSVSERFLNSLAQSGYKSTTGQISLLDASGMTYSVAERSYLSEFLTDYFVLMLSMVFTLFFCQVGVETIVPVVMQDYFGYGEFENSLVYMAGGAEALVVFFSVAVISRYVRDTNLMVLGWVTLTAAHVWLLVFLPQFQAEGTGSVLEVSLFMVGLVMLYFGYAVSSVANTGLFSKCLSANTQGLGQGLRRMVSYLGLIFGPTWAGATVRKPGVFLGIPLGIVAIHAMMLLASFRDLRSVENEHRDIVPPTHNSVVLEQDEEEDEDEEDRAGERRPLIR